MGHMTRAVIFDCDGVLVDSEILVGRIEAEMLESLGAEISLDDIVRNFMGLSDATMAEALRRTDRLGSFEKSGRTQPRVCHDGRSWRVR